jgi:hypothetical protein
MSIRAVMSSVLVLVLLVPPSSGCRSRHTATDASEDAGLESDGASTDATPPAITDAGDAGACHDRPSLGQTILSTTDPGPAPSMTGGAVQDGTYVLTSAVEYFDGPIPTDYIPQRVNATWVIRGGSVEVVSPLASAAEMRMTETITSYSADENGTPNRMNLKPVCPSAGAAEVALEYTATATEFSHHLGPKTQGTTLTFTKR